MPVMRKKIIISESQYRLLEEYQDEVTYYKFYTEVLKFLKELLSEPSKAEPSKVLKEHGITRQSLIKKLKDEGILTQTHKVTEEDGKSKMNVKYSVLRKDFEKKLHRLHTDLCECVKPQVKNVSFESIDEEDTLEEEGMAGGMSCGFAMQGGGTNPNAGQYDAPLGDVQHREFWFAGNKLNKKKKKEKSI